jgi:hypothetical protein
MLSLNHDQMAAAEQLHLAQLRLTAFYTDLDILKNPTWWRDVVGSEPESRTVRPSANELQESGLIDDKSYLLSVRLNRVDWLVIPTLPTEENVLPERWIGSFADTVPSFSVLMERWLAIAPPGISRLAVGIVADRSATSKIEAYEKLAELLPALKIDVTGSSELLYQINRPKVSKVINGLTINRLAKWSSSAFMPIQLVLNAGVQQSTPLASSNAFVARTEADINTGPEFSELAASSTVPLLAELFEYAWEILTVGDVQK